MEQDILGAETMTPRMIELRIKELTKGLDVIKKHIAAGNLGRACEILQQTFLEFKRIGMMKGKKK